MKDIKKYKFFLEDSTLKSHMKQAIMGTISESYENYLKIVKPQNAYSVEDIELTIDKLLKIN